MNHQAVSQLVLGIFRLNGQIAAWGDRFAAASQLTTARWQVLGAIASGETPPTAPQIAERMGISRQGVQKQLNLLLAEQLVNAQDNAAHKRSPCYTLTASGQALLDDISTRWRAQASVWAQDYPPDALAAALTVLETLSRQIQSPEQP